MVKYDSYKDSGVEWIGEIPNHWNRKNLKLSFKIEKGKLPKGLTDINNENLLPYLSMDVLRGNPPKEFSPLSDGVYIKKGEIGIIWDGSNSGEIIKINQDGILSSTVSKLSSKDESIEDDYSFYLLKYYETDFRLNTIGMGIPHMDGNHLKFTKFLIPPLQEQQQIVSFLDIKTSLIDSLIEKTQKKIELLKEKRTSLINHTVTKGLNPNVEMKDSGVEWIGEIPNHWSVKKLKYISEILPSNVDKHIYPDEIQVRLCNYTDVYYNDYITVDTPLKKGSCNENEFNKFSLEKGYVIITKDSETPDDIGVPTFVKDDLDNVVCGYHLTMIKPLTTNGGFIFRFIQSDRTRRYFEVNSNGITRYGLGKSSIENLILPIPPNSEQQQIVEYLNEQTNIIDTTITKEQKRIKLLKEYRQSLISEVVTGKIKVCD